MIVRKARTALRGMRRPRLSRRIRLERVSADRQSVCGLQLPPGLQLASPLPEPIFTPCHQKRRRARRKHRHGRNVARMLGEDSGEPRARSQPRKSTSAGRDHAAQRGIIVADTKFEFGTARRDKLLLIDECLTPGFVALLASRSIRRRPKSAELRQTIRARLSRDARLEQTRRRRPNCPRDVIAKNGGEISSKRSSD